MAKQPLSGSPFALDADAVPRPVGGRARPEPRPEPTSGSKPDLFETKKVPAQYVACSQKRNGHQTSFAEAAPATAPAPKGRGGVGAGRLHSSSGLLNPASVANRALAFYQLPLLTPLHDLGQ